MEFLVCIAGLPPEIVHRVQAMSPALFTGDKKNLPLVREIKGNLAYREGMSDFYLDGLARRLTDIPPERAVGIGLVYVAHGGWQLFVESFFPFAVTVPIDPFYPSTWEKHERQARLTETAQMVVEATKRARQRISLMRDNLSGQKFSPLLLPLRNFRSEVLGPSIRAIFERIGGSQLDASLVPEYSKVICVRHPLKRVAVENLPPQPFFEDDRSLRFKSPGSDNHGVARKVADGHFASCLINGRARLGAPIKSGFHYDCNYEKGGLDAYFPNCHSEDQAPSKGTHVNISPNDAIR